MSIIVSTVQILVPKIMAICMMQSPNYSDIQKEECYLYIVNCAIDFNGELKSEDRLDYCYDRGKKRLNI